LDNKWGIDLEREHNCQCPRCARNGRDRSQNNLKVYGGDNGAFCWSCNFTIPSAEHREAMGWDETEDEEEYVSTREKITAEQNEQIKSYTGTDGKGYRGIRKDINTFFGVRYEYDQATGEPIKQYVPTTIDGELCGYRVRAFPKDFSQSVGQVGKEVDFVGEFRFKSHTRTLLILGGEIKMLAAYQMLVDDQKNRDKMNFETVATVCGTLGEAGTARQAQSRYEFCSQFAKIIVAMDSDEAGEEAAEKLAKVLPRGRVFIMKMRYKDADTYIAKGKEKEFVQDYWNAKPWSPAGLYTADQLYDAALAHVSMERLPMPSFLPTLNRMLGGGIPKGGCIVLIAAASSIGKTTVLNQCLVEWIMNDNERFGVVSLEATAGDYAANLISYYTKTRYMGIESRDERINMMSSEATREAAAELFTREDGSPRFVLCDDRGEKLNIMQSKIEEMVKAMGCTAILVDVTSDLLSGLTIAEQEMHMDWQKKLTKETGVTLINVVHIRKAASGQKEGSRGAAVSDESIMGTSTLYKSASIIIGLQRDKMAVEDFVRNTTEVMLLKNRANADTGPAGKLYYDKATHRLHDMDAWMAEHPAEF
jgi:5S rRNA maturation endonuclease (ribonuclease M5)